MFSLVLVPQSMSYAKVRTPRLIPQYEADSDRFQLHSSQASPPNTAFTLASSAFSSTRFSRRARMYPSVLLRSCLWRLEILLPTSLSEFFEACYSPHRVIVHRFRSHPDKGWTAPQVAVTLAFICGFIVLGIGLIRLGWIVEWIPAPAVSGFMTGSAISIAAGQVPALFGIQSRLNTRAETYRVIINTLKNLKYARLDAAFGVIGLFSLYAIRWSCEWASRRYPRRARTFFFISILRNGFVVIVLTLSAWLYLRGKADAKGKYPPPAILLTVPRGFKVCQLIPPLELRLNVVLARRPTDHRPRSHFRHGRQAASRNNHLAARAHRHC